MILVLGVSAFLRALLGRSTAVALENIALRHQLMVLQRSSSRPRLRRQDRILWVCLSRLWANWRPSLLIVQPATVVAWHRQGFRLYWRCKSRLRSPGRPPMDLDILTLIRRMARENPTLYSIRPESQVRREDPFLPRKQRAEGRGGEAAKHGGPALADQRTKTPGTPGGSAPDCPGRQENGAEGSRESCPPEGRYKGNLPFLFRARACEVRRRRISALLPRSRLGGSDACGLGRR
jgi:hypothetical protein